MVGPNGAGKTTLVSAIAGLVRPDAGEISVMGVDALVKGRAARRLIGLAPQQLGLSPTLTVAQNLEFFARLGGASRAAARRGAAATADALGIAGLLGRPAGRLSGGEQRRAHVAAALAHRPPLLLLDEPTSGVDVSARQPMLELVRDAADRGSAVCYSTHHLDEVDALAASVALLHRGRLVARGRPAAVVARHARSIVELRFAADVAPGSLPALAGLEVDGPRVRVSTDDPGRALATLVPALAGDVPALVSVDVVKPGLEAVFVTLTGDRYPGGAGAADAER